MGWKLCIKIVKIEEILRRRRRGMNMQGTRRFSKTVRMKVVERRMNMKGLVSESSRIKARKD